ncbi:hypothetical protein DPMN_156803 [Dreissena polymorpha]|uniref:Uncharacterized protein n=1 Tax=Dreissena polymorpha TaxID=45954 RepID=A0A9D4JC60_DREPO|nr:hypothetical protein DPMN_156803 [Dreissena polymorpha]
MSSKLDTDYFFQPNEDLKLVAPRVVRKKGEVSIVCLVNPIDNYQTLKRGKLIGHAFGCTTIDDSGVDDMAQEVNGLQIDTKIQ